MSRDLEGIVGYRLGIDIGGTFTDVVLVDGLGALTSFKVPSTPSDPGLGFIDAVDRARSALGLDRATLLSLVHATTVATNAIIEGKSAQVALVVTSGFRDLLEIARQIRPDLFDLMRDKPRPLVPRDLVFEVAERIGPKGELILPVDMASVERVAGELRPRDLDAVVVCFLHSYVDGSHEEAVGKRLEELLPGVDISLSSRVWPEFREYFRASTTIVNAAVRPAVRRYIGTIEVELERRDLPRSFHVMQSSGGVMTADAAKDLPVLLIESGPAAGLVGAALLGRQMGWPNVISIDIGGTTAKVGLILDGRPRLTYEYEVGAMAASMGGRTKASGYPIRTPVLDLVEIGAGGGSIAWIDSGGALRVGPESAGADPGPACYVRGGERPTLTDANVVLGRIDPDAFLGGEMRLDPKASAAAIEHHCAASLGRTVAETAAGIIEVANASMTRALRLVSVQRGYDPREFVLVAFGGAGPLHANALAAELGIPRIIVPPHAGVLSAVGLLSADIQHVASVTAVTLVQNLGQQAVTDRFAALEMQARGPLRAQGFSTEEVTLLHYADMRFKGQSYELAVLVRDPRSPTVIDDLRNRFLEEHERAYGHAAVDQDIEIVNWKVFAAVGNQVPALRPRTLGFSAKPHVPSERRTQLGGDGIGIRTHWRDSIGRTQVVRGPAVVAEMNTTTFVEAGFAATVDDAGNLILERGAVDL
jgi:N-methylhydantoinase A